MDWVTTVREAIDVQEKILKSKISRIKRDRRFTEFNRKWRLSWYEPELAKIEAIRAILDPKPNPSPKEPST